MIYIIIISRHGKLVNINFNIIAKFAQKTITESRVFLLCNIYKCCHFFASGYSKPTNFVEFDFFIQKILKKEKNGVIIFLCEKNIIVKFNTN